MSLLDGAKRFHAKYVLRFMQYNYRNTTHFNSLHISIMCKFRCRLELCRMLFDVYFTVQQNCIRGSSEMRLACCAFAIFAVKMPLNCTLFCESCSFDRVYSLRLSNRLGSNSVIKLKSELHGLHFMQSAISHLNCDVRSTSPVKLQADSRNGCMGTEMLSARRFM